MTFTVRTYDTKCAAALAVNAIKLAIQNNVSAVIGDVCSGSSSRLLPYANVANIPVITPGSTSPSLSIPNDYFFRTVPNDNFQGQFLASYLAKFYTRVAIVYAADESYGEGITHVLSVNINALSPNVTLVATVGFLSRDPQGLALPWTNGSLTGIINARPDVVVFLTNNPNGVIGAGIELRALNFKGDFAGADTVAGYPIFAEYPELDGIVASSLYTGTLAFKSKYVAAYGGTIDEVPPVAAQAYDALKIIQKVCVINGRRATGKEMFSALNKRGFGLNPAATGRVTFDLNGFDTFAQFDVLQLINSTWSIRKI